MHCLRRVFYLYSIYARATPAPIAMMTKIFWKTFAWCVTAQDGAMGSSHKTLKHRRRWKNTLWDFCSQFNGDLGWLKLEFSSTFARMLKYVCVYVQPKTNSRFVIRRNRKTNRLRMHNTECIRRAEGIKNNSYCLAFENWFACACAHSHTRVCGMNKNKAIWPQFPHSLTLWLYDNLWAAILFGVYSVECVDGRVRETMPWNMMMMNHKNRIKYVKKKRSSFMWARVLWSLCLRSDVYAGW